MQKLTQSEFNGLIFAPRGKAIDATVADIIKLNLNEAMILRQNEWKLKQSPQSYFYNNQDKFNGMAFRVRKLANNDGWAVLRIA